jgi:hypothetical protein
MRWFFDIPHPKNERKKNTKRNHLHTTHGCQAIWRLSLLEAINLRRRNEIDNLSFYQFRRTKKVT